MNAVIKFSLITTVVAILFSLATVTAYAAKPIWTDHNEHDPGVTAPHAPGEKGGTEDMNIGIGKLQEDNNETKFAFLRERASIARGTTRE